MRKLYLTLYLLSLSISIIAMLILNCGFYKPTASADYPAYIPVYRSGTGTVDVIPTEIYVTCVVTCEVPCSFHEEALKAQAVAARTYAAAKIKSARSAGNPSEHPLAPICDSTHCQVFRNTSELKHTDGWRKIKSAVSSTGPQMLYYDGSLVMNALFHASSGGQTENSEDVFITAVPYLQSVNSPYENNFPRNGHGVGLSQQGANGMANKGYSYREILAHYYKGTYVQ